MDPGNAVIEIETALGTNLEIEFLGEQVGATVAKSPLWDPKGERIKV